jgi:uncharacterized protein YyaL (SSP411 family)
MSNGEPAANRLASEISPYLLQHRENPVHWLPWDEAALSRARGEGKPILLSIGYAACHWCHVMARESFENPGIADLINRWFVAIKVDREERPDLDQIFQGALSLLGQPGGWPLTMFLTPEGTPFWGGTYFPPVPRGGRPGFAQVLQGVAEVWSRTPAAAAENGEALRDGLRRLNANRPGAGLTVALLDRVAERLVRLVDPLDGGIGEAPKFPMTGAFEILWRAWLRSGREKFRDAVEVTLTAICQGGLYDHLGGGFARYATDDRWLVPHFEKMLYDNAQMIRLLTRVWLETGEPLYAQRVRETVDWALREMRTGPSPAAAPAFASSLDADSEHREGWYYVWSAGEIDRLLGADAPAFRAAYDVREEGNWEGMNILHRRHLAGLHHPEQEEQLAHMRRVLLAARDRRVRPGWDDKVLADWNGLMISALVEAGSAFERPDWLQAAAAAFEFVTRVLHTAEGDRHCWRLGRARHAALLDDHAFLAQAALALFQLGGDPAYLAAARGRVAELDRHFWDPAAGGYFLTPDHAEPLVQRPKHASDHSTPSGNGVMVQVLARLWLLTGEDDYRQRAEALIRAFAGEAEGNVLGLASLLAGVELLEAGTSVVVVGDPAAAATQALYRVVRRQPRPDWGLLPVRPGQALNQGHPAAGKTMVEGRATAYLCRHQTCSLPLTEPAALGAALAQNRPLIG